MTTDVGELALAYYEHIDNGAYGSLRDLLADGFVQDRGDMTLEGADRFVTFMREERPDTDTTHVVERVYRTDPATPDDSAETVEHAAVEGRLERADGETWFRFVDTFTARGGRLIRLGTYTR
jgi:ketosteroid isomerase-like protein